MYKSKQVVTGSRNGIGLTLFVKKGRECFSLYLAFSIHRYLLGYTILLYIKRESCEASAILEYAVMHLKSLQYVSPAHSFHCSRHCCIYNGVFFIVILLSLH